VPMTKSMSPFWAGSTLGLSALIGLLAIGNGCSGGGKHLAGDTIGGDDSGTSPSGDDSGTIFGDIGGGDDSATISSGLTITPNNSIIYIDTGKSPIAPGVQSYKLSMTDASGATTDVTSSATLTIDNPALGTFSGQTFTSALTLPGTALGVTGTVTANAMGQNVQAKLTIVKLRKTPDATGKRDFFFTVPYEMAPDPTSDVLLFGTNIQKVDVVFTQDTTGSMGSSISSVISTMTTSIFPGLSKAIPSVGIAVVDHKDSDDSDVWVAKVLNTINTDPSVSAASYSSMSADGGGDEPEAQEIAMYYAITGAAIPCSPPISMHTPAPGTTGGVDFRAGAVPVIVNITDAHWHDGVDNPWPNGISYMDMTRLTAAFKTINAKFIGIQDQHGGDPSINVQPQTLSDNTNSNVVPAAFGPVGKRPSSCPIDQCCTGQGGAGKAPDGPGGTCRLVFDIMDGAGIDTSLITAIQAISVGSTYDITYKLANDAKNKDATGAAVDATQFFTQLRAMGEGSVANGCDPSKYTYKTKKTNPANAKDDTFVAVTVGTPVCFEVIPKTNTTVKAAASAQFFNAFINMVGEPGDVDLGDQRTVVFLVPPAGPGVH
jgi:hypothetical protein